MRFYFCWVSAEEEFNPLKHAKEEIQVFSLIIQQKETEFATAKVLIKDLAFSEKDHAFISFDDGQKIHLLFKGRRVGMPLLQESSLSQLELVAEPLKAYEKLQDILK
ncbi:MAG: hypothetical protein HYS39_03640, partial [Proteobacteria bacterium]|nr:hypothetical protein [Pseudomonadota bacterium]